MPIILLLLMSSVFTTLSLNYKGKKDYEKSIFYAFLTGCCIGMIFISVGFLLIN